MMPISALIAVWVLGTGGMFAGGKAIYHIIACHKNR